MQGMHSLAVVTVAGILCVLHASLSLRLERLDALTRTRVLASTIRSVATMAWPVALLSALTCEDRCRHALLIPLLFNFAVWAVDFYLVHHAPSSDPIRPASIRFDHYSFSGLTFGLCSFLGARYDSKYAHLFLYAVVGCLVLVLPSHNLAPGCIEEQIFESVQKAALMWCIGFLIAGVVLTRSTPA